jgi:hypothetical protein
MKKKDETRENSLSRTSPSQPRRDLAIEEINADLDRNSALLTSA